MPEQDKEVLVDHAGDDEVRPTEPDQAVATFWAQSLVQTVAAYVGHPVPVRVTLRGESFRLFDVLDTARALTYRQVDERMTAGLTLPTGAPTSGPVVVVGAAESSVDDVTWHVVDRVSRQTLFQGTTAAAADRTFAFAAPSPPGRYDLRVDGGTDAGRPSGSYGGSIQVR